jgi:hypothetical protein
MLLTLRGRENRAPLQCTLHRKFQALAPGAAHASHDVMTRTLLSLTGAAHDTPHSAVIPLRQRV